MHGLLIIAVLFIAVLFASMMSIANSYADERGRVAAGQTVQAIVTARPLEIETQDDFNESGWTRKEKAEKRDPVSPPSTLAIIACRVDSKMGSKDAYAPQDAGPDWHMPLECMRVIETVTDAAAMSHLWLRQMTPNLADYDTCAEVAMTYAPVWESSHHNWTIVKVGCPTKIVDADGRIIGWHMPECQGTLPGTSYPLRCRFDPSEI